MTLTLYVIESIHEGALDKQQLNAVVDRETYDATVGTTGLSPDKPVSAEKLWQEILQNLHKDLDTRSHIGLSTNQIESLTNGIDALQGSSASGGHQGEKPHENAILFTCGHHFVKESFTGAVLSGFEDMLVAKDLPQSASLLNAYYKRNNSHPMACPNCVFQAIQAL